MAKNRSTLGDGADDILLDESMDIDLTMDDLRVDPTTPSPANGAGTEGEDDMATASATQEAAHDSGSTSNGLLSVASSLMASFDAVQTNVFIADADLTLVYANAKALETAAEIADDIYEAFGLRLDELLGGSIHRFHRDPKRIEQILRDPRALPHEASFSFGGTTLLTSINSIPGPDGEVVGYIVNWDNITERQKTERAQARMNAMLESAPTNVLMADADLNLTYVNPASRRTLETLQQYLPIPVDQLLGSNIDIFHKDPSYQRKLLADPKNFPIEAQIQLGPETLKLLVSRIEGADGDYIGPMLTWEVITEKLKLETEQARVQAMVENSPTNVLMADTDLNILYVNPASRRTLETLQQYLPIPVDEIVGANIDIFHKDPAYQRKILSDPKNFPIEAVIQIGPESAKLLVSRINDQNGNYMGPMLTWEVITEKLKLETEQARIQAMVENSPTNVMMADTDLNIMYVNPASMRTLESLQQYLPIPASQVVGANIDIFHKDPSYQRRILSDPANFPIEANIQLGPETASLLVSRINDQNGNYMGPMVTWSVITKQLEMEQQIGTTADTLASSSEELTTVNGQISSNAEETTSQANAVSAAAEEMSKNVETVATGAEELASSIKEIASNATEAAKVAQEAVDMAEVTRTTMGSLDTSSNEIGKVIKVITSIAEQTNLLALNATIEAARAGEAGKGFAVVANEVKELAKETAKATEDIGQKIESIQADTQAAVEAIGQISTVIDRINEIQNSIAGAVEEQTATTAEIGQNITEAARGSQDIAENISNVAMAAQNTSEGVMQATKTAAELSQLATDLKALLAKSE